MLVPSFPAASVAVALSLSVVNAAYFLHGAEPITSCDVAGQGCRADVGDVSLLQRRLGGTAAPRAAKTPAGPSHAGRDGRPPVPPILYLKTHKTGSSTVQRIVQGMAERRNLSIMLPADNNYLGYPGAFPGTPQTKLYGPPAHQFDVICNHAVLSTPLMHAYLKPGPHFVTIVRDPDEQMISAKNYYRDKVTWDQHLRSMENSKATSCCDFRFKNFQAFDLGWYDFVGRPTTRFDNNQTKIHEWLATLDNYLNSTLVLEHLEEGLALFRSKVQVDLQELRFVDLNEAHGTKVYPTKAQRARLRALGNVDRALYAHLRKRFWKEWYRGNVSQLEADAAALRHMNRELQRSCDEGDSERCHRSWYRSASSVTRCLKNSSRDHACAT